MGVEFPRPEWMSPEDWEGYLHAIAQAWSVYCDRDRLRQGLWKNASIDEHAQQLLMKSERIVHAISLMEFGSLEEEEAKNQIAEEADDIINYAVFLKRVLAGFSIEKSGSASTGINA